MTRRRKILRADNSRTNITAVVLTLSLLVLACSCASNADNAAATSRDMQSGTPAQAPAADTAPAPAVAQTGATLASHTDAPALTKGREGVLFDFRRDMPLPRPSLSEEDAGRLYSAVYGEQYGRVEPLLKSAATGSFTKAGASQTVYLLQKNVSEGESRDASVGAQLAVFEGDKLVANIAAGRNFIRRINHYANILATSDLDGDGLDELLLGASYFNRGIKLSWAWMVELEDGRLRVVKDFGMVDEDRCDAAAGERILAGTLLYERAEERTGDWPQFKVEFYQSRCASVRDERRPEKFSPAPDAEIASDK